jgi:hypothetical protein
MYLLKGVGMGQISLFACSFFVFQDKILYFFFCINQFLRNFLEIYFVAQSTVEKKVILKMYLLKGVGMGQISLFACSFFVFQDKILYLSF